MFDQAVVPPLQLSEQGEDEKVYSQEAFIELLLDLSQRSVLYYCPYDESTLKSFYQQLTARDQAIALPLSTVHQFISEMKKRNRSQLQRQAAYYEEVIGRQLKQGVEAISRRQLRKAMDRYDGDLQIITHIMLQNSKEADFVSCPLVLQLIQQIREELKDAVIPELSITKLKTMRINSDRQAEGEAEGEVQASVSPIFQQIGEYEVKRLIEHLSCIVHRKLGFYSEFIIDQEVRDDLENFLSTLKPLQKAIAEEVDLLIDSHTQLVKRSEQFSQVLGKLEEEQRLQGDIVEGLHAEVNHLREELKEAEARNESLQATGLEWQQTARGIQIELQGASSYCNSLQQQLADCRRNYDELYADYCRLDEQGKRKSLLTRQENAQKIFASRSLKEQLEDTAQRLSRLLQERQRERKQATQAEESKACRIMQLEVRLEELERQLKEKNEYLCDYIRQSKLQQLTHSQLRISKVPPNIALSHLLDHSLHKDKSVSDSSSQSESIVSQQDPNSSLVGRRISRASRVPLLNTLVPILQQDNSLEDISELHAEQNALAVLQEDIEERPQEAFKKKQAAEVSPPKGQQAVEKAVGKYFFSRGTQMNVYGQKFQTFILVTAKRFCYFDTKLRLEKYLRLEHIKEVTFLMENPNLFILKPAAPEALPKHILHDMIFMTRNVTRLQAILAQLREKFKFAVTVRKGEHAWLRVHKEEHNLGMGVPSYTNPFRIALSPLPVFYAQVKEEGLWASKANAVMVVQPMGIVCFLADEAYEIEAKREFFCLLPITEHLRLTDKKNSKEAPDKKIVVEYGRAWQKYYQIIFQSKDDKVRFRKAVDQQLASILQAREQLKARLQAIFPQ